MKPGVVRGIVKHRLLGESKNICGVQQMGEVMGACLLVHGVVVEQNAQRAARLTFDILFIKVLMTMRLI